MNMIGYYIMTKDASVLLVFIELSTRHFLRMEECVHVWRSVREGFTAVVWKLSSVPNENQCFPAMKRRDFSLFETLIKISFLPEPSESEEMIGL